MKGSQTTRTKAQNITEVVFKQNGFLSGLNEDMPKSDVGDTQLTIAKNVIPYRDRVEARGGVKPIIDYYYEDDTEFNTMVFGFTESVMYDGEFDAFFVNYSGVLQNFDKNQRTTTNCYGYNVGSPTDIDNFTSQAKIKNGLFFSEFLTTSKAYTNNYIELRDDDTNYFVRPLTSDTTSTTKINVYPASTGDSSYAFLTTFVRIVDGIVIAESNVIGKAILSHSAELDGTITPFSLYREANLYPQDYYNTSRLGTDNFYTHIRYYRTELTTNTDLNDFYSDAAYYLTDYDINAADLLPAPGAGPTLNLNISDTELISDSSRATLWQSGYQPIEGTGVACSSSGMFLARNEARKNEFVYCPIGSGDNRKYFGWYNPLFQYGSVDGDITKMIDMGSYVLITTKSNTYYIDTVNYIEDEGQRSAGVFTPILSQSVSISDVIGVAAKQADAFIRTAKGSAMAITSDGEIREFAGYQWGPDLTIGKVSSITKGDIYRNNLYCQASFANDTYYLGYHNGLPFSSGGAVSTLRLGTTEESGHGFSELEGGGWNLNRLLNSSTYLGQEIFFSPHFFYNVNGSLHITRDNEIDDLISIYEYTGDKFDKKLNKDVIDLYTDVGGYQYTEYRDIPVEIEFPEVTASSEDYFLYFLKANYYLRADRYGYKVTNETLKGYEIGDDDLELVSLSDTTFGMDARIGETDDVVAANEGFSPSSAVVLQREVQGHRVRLMLRADAAGWQLTGMEAKFKRHIRKNIQDTTTTISNVALNTGLFCHITEKLSNLAVGSSVGSTFDIGAPLEGAKIGRSADGRLIDGATAITVTGPGSGNAGFASNGDIDFMSNSEAFSPYNYTVMFWSISQFGDTNINKVTTAYTTSSGNVFDGNVTTGWRHFCYRVRSSALDLYIDGVLDSSIVISPFGHISSDSIRVGKGEYSDIRMYNKTITEEQLLFYIDNILNNNGDYFNGY
jgi:hypothetical protein